MHVKYAEYSISRSASRRQITCQFTASVACRRCFVYFVSWIKNDIKIAWDLKDNAQISCFVYAATSVSSLNVLISRFPASRSRRIAYGYAMRFSVGNEYRVRTSVIRNFCSLFYARYKKWWPQTMSHARKVREIFGVSKSRRQITCLWHHVSLWHPSFARRCFVCLMSYKLPERISERNQF